MYIILFALKKQRGFSKRHFLKALKEVIVPVTMTSVVNVCMFAILSISVRYVHDSQNFKKRTHVEVYNCVCRTSRQSI
jgi:hypothetical protein